VRPDRAESFYGKWGIGDGHQGAFTASAMEGSHSAPSFKASRMNPARPTSRLVTCSRLTPSAAFTVRARQLATSTFVPARVAAISQNSGWAPGGSISAGGYLVLSVCQTDRFWAGPQANPNRLATATGYSETEPIVYAPSCSTQA